MDESVEIRAYSAPWRMSTEILIKKVEFNKEYLIESIVWKEIKEHYAYPSQSVLDLGIRNKASQVLMDDLWNCGLRPTEGSGSAGSLLATQNHLKDMQDIVQKQMNHILKLKQS